MGHYDIHALRRATDLSANSAPRFSAVRGTAVGLSDFLRGGTRMSDDLEFWHHHCGVSVADLEASIAWYGDVLGSN